MNLQEIFNTAASAIIAQGEPSTYEGMCRYRQDLNAGDPIRCAIGHLIPDELYTPDMDTNLSMEDVVETIGLSSFQGELHELQEAHDHSSDKPNFVNEFRRRTRRLFRSYGLSTEVLDA